MKSQFPFIIVPDKNPENKETINENTNNLLKLIKKNITQNEEMQEKIKKLLKNIVVIEASIDEILSQQNNKDQIKDFFKSLISVLNNLDSLKFAIQKSGDAEWKKGIKFFYEKLFTLFKKYNLQISAEVGMKFNPSLHYAVDTRLRKRIPKGTIIEIIENGWIYNKEVIKYAKVIVAK